MAEEAGAGGVVTGQQVIVYGHEDATTSGYSKPITGVLIFEMFWYAAWAIVFVIQVLGNRFVNEWVGLLVYLIGFALVPVLLQIIFTALYFRSKQAGYSIQDPAYQETLANNGIIVMAVFGAIFVGTFIAVMWGSWLCGIKGQCSYDATAADTDPATTDELHSFLAFNILSALFSVVETLALLRAVYTLLMPAVIVASVPVESSIYKERTEMHHRNHWGQFVSHAKRY